jgi:predicted Zn-dependent protease
MMRSGFSMLTAIGIMVLIATVMTLMVMLSTTSADKTANIYVKEQSHFLARSATEYALLAASAHNYGGANCLENVNVSYDIYTINVSLTYIGTNLPCTANRELGAAVQTAGSVGTVIVDTEVIFPVTATQNVRYVRRTLQKL